MNKITSLTPENDSIEERVRDLLSQMTLEEKVGQMHQLDGTWVSEDLKWAVRQGSVGSLLNQTDPHMNRELQRIAIEESRLGIPLMIARDVIHGYKTVFPLPIGQAATWNPSLVEAGARFAAEEAAQMGISWTFAPMLDISRDPRWGRIAESLGEDPYLTGVIGVAMTKGFQGTDLASPTSIAACAKHFAGYGASEGGRDYNTTNIPPNELRNIYMIPFKETVEAGIATIMSSFSDVDGMPAHAHEGMIRGILREEWQFDGLHVSDWDAVRELCTHGVADGERGAAKMAAEAGINVEMVGGAYERQLAGLVHGGSMDIETIDDAVTNILRTKFRLGLFDDPYARIKETPEFGSPEALEAAKAAATESIVLLKNEMGALPLKADGLKSVAVIGPMADAPAEQLGTWVFDGDPALSVTPLQAIRDALPETVTVHHAQGLRNTINRETDLFDDAVAAATRSDIAILFIGEDAILSGEAHCRADIGLPGIQTELFNKLIETGTRIIPVIIAGRPLTFSEIADQADALLFAFHPGTMTGPALFDVLFGNVSPSGRLPVTFPTVVGQVPIYYNHKNTGRPASPDKMAHIEEIEVGAPQTSLGMSSFYLDEGYKPRYPFGFGLTYSHFSYDHIALSSGHIHAGETLLASAIITNNGQADATETVQLYIRDLVGSITRPVRELKGFKKVSLHPGESARVEFELQTEDLAFYRRDKSFGCETGHYHLWIGPNAQEGIWAEFWLDIPAQEG